MRIIYSDDKNIKKALEDAKQSGETIRLRDKRFRPAKKAKPVKKDDK